MKRNALALAVCLAICGCGKPALEIAPVEGVLTINGQPAGKISIQFVPDIDHGTKGPASSAKTDGEGRFKLQLYVPDNGEMKDGAVVGWHRVVLSDMRMAESATGAGIPVRLTPAYTLAGSTPLRQEVKSGPQTITLSVP